MRSNEETIKLASLKAYPFLIRELFFEGLLAHVGKALSAFLGLKPKSYSLIFFKRNDKKDCFQYILTRNELEKLKNHCKGDMKKLIGLFSTMMEGRWGPSDSIVGRLLGDKVNCKIDGIKLAIADGRQKCFIIVVPEWTRQYRRLLKLIRNKEEKKRRETIFDLETKVLLTGQDFLVDIPINIRPPATSRYRTIGALQLTSKGKIEDEDLYNLIDLIGEYSSSFWLSLEIDRSFPELVKSFPVLQFIGGELSKIEPLDSARIIEYSD